MPRRDAPGALHHVLLRGVAQCDIFVDDRDREFLFGRIALVTREAGAGVLAFAFMSNHVHAVVKTGPVPLRTVMARINTAYGLAFNRRHQRVGHLFQNRYGAKPILDEAHLRNSICYVNANPLAAGLVPSLAALERYRWAGHGSLVGRLAPGFLDVRAALSVFADDARAARAELRALMREWRRDREPDHGPAPLHLPELEAAIAASAARHGVSAAQIASGARHSEVCRARAEVAYSAIARHGLPAAEVALRLGVTHAAALRAAARGAAHGAARGVSPRSQARMNVP
jgi:REP element-mobilizing transposase RayT